jgi:hypothetical protein
MIDIIPFRTNKLTTKLTTKEILKRIDLLFDKHNDLIGYTENNKFIMERKIQYQNPFKPIVRGQLIENNGVTKLTVNYRPKTFTLIFYMSIIVAFIFAAFKFRTQTILGNSPSGQFAMFALILFIILMIGFNVERNKIERRIKGQVE